MIDSTPEKFRRGFPNKDAYADQKALCSDARVIFDVGANAGYTSQKYRKLFPDAAIHAFEPFPEIFETLSAKFSNDSKFYPVSKAVWSSSGTRTLHTNSMNVTNAMSPIVDNAFQYLPDNFTRSEGIAVETTSLDDYCLSVGVDVIDVLKVDAQGSELEILRGGERLLGGRRVKLVFTELIFVQVYEDQASFHDIAAFLASFGYRVFDFFDFTYDSSGQLKWGDAIFKLEEHG